MSPRRLGVATALALALMPQAAAAQAAGQIAPLERGAWPSEGPPRPLAARDVMFPPYEIRTLPNGLQVVAVLHHEQPVVSMRMIVRAGSALDPRDKLGLAQLAAALMTQGTVDKTATQLNEEIDFLGGAMGAGAGTDLSFLNMVVMKDSFETGLRMLSDMARRPAFATEEIDRQRQQMLSGLQVSLEDPEFIANAVFDRLVYGFHPYGLPQTGTPQTIGTITRDDLVAFHRRMFVPNNTILAIVGDVTADEAFSLVGKVFGDWERRAVPDDSAMAPPEATRRLVIVNKPDAVQTEIRVGHVGVKRNHPDYMALNLAVRILGGEGANRLHQVLRTSRGLTYGAQAEMDTLRDSGDFEASTNTRSEATGEVLRLMVDEFWRLQRERVRERELADAKAYLVGSFPLTIETPDAIATQVLNVLFYGLPVEDLQSFRQRVNAVTVDDIERVARFYLHPDRLSIVLVGNAAAFASQLRGIGFATFETVNMPDLDLTTADFKTRAAGGGPAGAGRLGAGRQQRLAYQLQDGGQSRPPSADAAATARALLDRVIAAKGGLDALRAIRRITAVTTSSIPSPDGTQRAKTTTYLEYPDKVRVETELPDASVVQIFDGTRGWVRDPRGVHEVPDRAVQDLQLSFRRDTVAVLLAAHDGRVRARLLPDGKDDSGARFRALELSGNSLDPMVLLIDPETHLIAKQTYVAGGLGQPLIEESFSDYRSVDGVQIAFKASVRRGGVAVLDRQVTDIRLNGPIDPALFTRPAS
jgi:zinc protease